jgi:hypothetical protein
VRVTSMEGEKERHEVTASTGAETFGKLWAFDA